MGKVCKISGFLICIILMFVSSGLYAGNTERILIQDNDEYCNQSSRPSISADGRFIAFYTYANQPGGTNSILNEILVYDRQTGVKESVSGVQVGATGIINNPSISGDGKFVAFESASDNLVSNDINGCRDIFVYNRQTGETKNVSVSNLGEQANNNSFNPSISADGRFVAFESSADNLVANDTNKCFDIFVHDTQIGTTQRISVSTGRVQANKHSFNSSISADGRFVAFESSSSNLVTSDNNSCDDIFIYDRQSGETKCVSISSNGVRSNSQSNLPSISADGRFVAFSSYSDNLVSDDTNKCKDVFVRDMQTGETRLVSISSDGVQANTYCDYPSISGDGRFITFQSDADSLVLGDTYMSVDVFVRDMQTGKTEFVSLSSDGVQADRYCSEASISADGKFVAFVSSATNLVSNDTKTGRKIFIHEIEGVYLDRINMLLEKGVTKSLVASVCSFGNASNDLVWSSSNNAVATVDAVGNVTAVDDGNCSIKVKTANGAFTATCNVTVSSFGFPVTNVWFTKFTTFLTKGASSVFEVEIYPVDATNKAVVWSSSNPSVASVDSNGKVTAVGGGNAVITVTTVDSSKTADCYLTVDAPVTGVTLNKSTLSLNKNAMETLVARVLPDDATNKAVYWSSSNPSVASVDSNGKVTAVSGGTCIIKVRTFYGGFTADCFVTVSIPVDNVTLNQTTMYLRTNSTKQLIASVSPEDASNKAVIWSSSDASIAKVDSHGNVIGVSTGSCTITATTVDGEKTSSCQVYVNVNCGSTQRVSLSYDAGEANNCSDMSSISGDGSLIAFNSEADNLVFGDINQFADIFVYNKQTGETKLVSVSTDGKQGNCQSGAPSISANGRFIVFDSVANNLVSDDINENTDVFVHDMQTGETKLVSISSDGLHGNLGSSGANINEDGRFIVFSSYANNLVSDNPGFCGGIFIHDMLSGETQCVSVSNDGVQGNGMSFHPSISADGRYIAFDSNADNLVSGDTNKTTDIFVYDKNNCETKRVSVSSDGQQANSSNYYPSISKDGRFISFISEANNLVPGDTNRFSDVFVHDIQTGITKRVSVSNDGVQANGSSWYASISGDGNFIVFASFANNFGSDNMYNCGEIFVYDMQSGKIRAASISNDGVQADEYSYYPSISADGKFVSFSSWSQNLVNDDTNLASDIFVRRMDTSVTNISLNKSILSLMDGSSESLVATLSPDDATNKAVNWSSSNTAIAIVDNNGKVTGISEGTCTVTATTVDGGFTASASVIVDGTKPVVIIDSIKQNGNLLVGNALKGTVGITISASDALSGLAGDPVVTIKDSAGNDVAFTKGGSVYIVAINATTANGTCIISATSTDKAGNTNTVTSSFNVNKNEISGKVTIPGFVGTSRDVTFYINGTIAKTVTLNFSSGYANYKFVDIADVATLSAKTNWTLRKKMNVTPTNGQASGVNFTLPGGDVNNSNSVNALDYSLLKLKWFTYDASCDINGDGPVNGFDYSILKANYFTSGDVK